jgi:uncharacterized protein YqjF (DUF2071 family)
MKTKFLTGEWRYLVMLNYEIDPEVLRPLVPRGTELDAWSGRYYVSLVGFLFRKTLVLGWLPIPFHRNFEEINLRFYVRRQGPEGWRRGVVFIKEIVPRWVIATVARVSYNENYVAHPMSHTLTLPEAGQGSVEYRWQYQGKTNIIGATFGGTPALPAPGSEPEFITEHYWGYCRQRNGSTMEYQVEHPQWPAWSATTSKLDCDVANFYGPQYREALSRPPTSAFVAEGSAIIVRGGGLLPTP